MAWGMGNVEGSAQLSGAGGSHAQIRRVDRQVLARHEGWQGFREGCEATCVGDSGRHSRGGFLQVNSGGLTLNGILRGSQTQKSLSSSITCTYATFDIPLLKLIDTIRLTLFWRAAAFSFCQAQLLVSRLLQQGSGSQSRHESVETLPVSVRNTQE